MQEQGRLPEGSWKNKDRKMIELPIQNLNTIAVSGFQQFDPHSVFKQPSVLITDTNKPGIHRSTQPGKIQNYPKR